MPDDNGLPRLSLTIGLEEAKTLQKVVSRALDRGLIVQEEADTVPAVVQMDGKTVQAQIRIKGDWTDHVATDKWSLRINLEDEKLLGMRVFSIQAPHTRGNLWEWLVLEAARREGVLAPRAHFVNVTINDNNAGVYYLEEHFSKELLEAQGRREGPIVLWDESDHWATLLQYHAITDKDVSMPIASTARDAFTANRAAVRAYGEKRLASVDSLSRSLFSAVDKMEELKDLAIANQKSGSQLRILEARNNLQGQVVEDIVDIDRLSCAHALASLFQVHHSLIWHNMRFYHDPVMNRLEPIMFDNMAHQTSGREPVMFRSQRIMKEFARSDAYYNGVFRYLARFCTPEYLDELMDELGPSLSQFEAALDREKKLPESYRVGSMVQRLRYQQSYLRDILYPTNPARFSSTFEFAETEGTTVSGTLSVNAWGTTRTPVVIEGFRFSNGATLRAQTCLLEGESEPELDLDGGVILPHDGRSIPFEFSMDDRLANLENVQQIIDASKAKTEASDKLDFEVTVLYRALASEEPLEERLLFRRRKSSWDAEGGRPAPVSLQEALDQHEFLELDPATGHLKCKQGRWKVTGDLIVPRGYTFEIPPSVRLQFESDAVLLSEDPLLFRGVPSAPITLEPVAGADRWRGVIVLRAQGRSEWRNVKISRTDAVARAGWVVTGGITFYHSPVTMTDCHIDGTLAEDGTNIFGTDFLLERVLFSECVSDSFDGDFVSGTVKNCLFQDGLADGVDFSGSDVDVVDCKFINMGDKAVSAGENSIVRVTGGIADGVSIGIAAKDRSQVEAKGMQIYDARNYALAVFIKKPEFGPATMHAADLDIRDAGLGVSIVQTDCVLELDGTLIPTVDLDVGQLYKEKILGQ